MRLNPVLKYISVSVLLAATLTVGGCARNPANPQDPYESYNRKVFKFNRGVDKVVYRPVAVAYTTVLPKFARMGISNFMSNVGEVDRFGNDILQVNFPWAFTTLSRFVINSTLGLAGLIDVATSMGIEKHPQDFGLTLAKWGYRDSRYLLLPFLPPSTARDTFGLAGDYFMTPWTYVRPNWIGWTAYGVIVTDRRASYLDTDKLVNEAFDPYLFVRNAYMQSRKAQVEKILHPHAADQNSFSGEIPEEPADATDAASTGSEYHPTSQQTAQGAKAG